MSRFDTRSVISVEDLEESAALVWEEYMPETIGQFRYRMKQVHPDISISDTAWAWTRIVNHRNTQLKDLQR